MTTTRRVIYDGYDLPDLPQTDYGRNGQEPPKTTKARRTEYVGRLEDYFDNMGDDVGEANRDDDCERILENDGSRDFRRDQ